MTTAQLLDLPDDGRERWLVKGEIREGGPTLRTRSHARTAASICGELGRWVREQPQPRGEVHVGDVGIRLAKNPDTTVAADIAYVSAEIADANPPDGEMLDGTPVLIVEILSPSDRHEHITEKVDVYLNSGVALVWVVDTNFRTITVYSSDTEPQLLNVKQEISAEPHLPCFRVAVADLFAR